MSLIVTELYDALIEAGATEEKAKAAAGAIPMVETLATKQDLAELKAEIKDDIAVLKRDMAVLKLAFAPAVLALLVKLVFFS
ncbi:MAG: hypothetical protein OXU75_18670 [Deltaproteobacteria bacterium]|nr:hypothetical protein [Deltaproteobacteria bacterium]